MVQIVYGQFYTGEHRHFVYWQHFCGCNPNSSTWRVCFSKCVLIQLNTLRLACSLTHWGRVTLICVNKLTIIGSDNGLSPGRRQAIIWTNDGILLIGPLGTNFSEILIEIDIFSFKKMHLKVSSAKMRSFCLGLNELRGYLLLLTHRATDVSDSPLTEFLKKATK